MRFYRCVRSPTERAIAGREVAADVVRFGRYGRAGGADTQSIRKVSTGRRGDVRDRSTIGGGQVELP